MDLFLLMVASGIPAGITYVLMPVYRNYKLTLRPHKISVGLYIAGFILACTYLIQISPLTGPNTLLIPVIVFIFGLVGVIGGMIFGVLWRVAGFRTI